MRSFRDHMKPIILCVLCALAVHANAENASVESPYFPLAVGNTWAYRCSLEGEYQSSKTFNIAASTQNKGQLVFRLEMRVDKDPKPLVSHLFVTPEGLVMEAFNTTLEDAKPLISVSPKRNERFGELKVVKIGPSEIKKYAKVKTVFLENYSAESPNMKQEKYLAWHGKRYGQGIGLLVEADGTGGDCELSKYSLKGAK